MNKSRVKRQLLVTDMTAMCDVAFMLLAFFIVIAKPQALVPMGINLPLSTPYHGCRFSDDINKGTLYIGNGKVMYSLADSGARAQTLVRMGDLSHIKFSKDEIAKFEDINIIGVSIVDLKAFIDEHYSERNSFNQPGIPVNAFNHELANWIAESNKAMKELYGIGLEVSIYGDASTKYPQIDYALTTLGSVKIFKTSFITNESLSKSERKYTN